MSRPSSTTLRIVTSGRVSGLPHIVRVRYVEDGDSFFVLAGDRKSDWVRNLSEARRGKVKLGGLVYEVSAEESESNKERVLSLFSEKYGKSIVSSWYGVGSTCVKLTKVAPATQGYSVVGEMSVKKGFVDWKSEGKAYYGEVMRAFDSASEEYDGTIGKNFINVWIRRRSIEVLSALLSPDDVLLEVGAGTGAEAIEIARRVSMLIATDISPAMVELLGKKVAARGLEGKVVPVRLTAAEIDRVRPYLGGRKLRVAYSFNGALNCEPRIGEFVEALASIMESGGHFVCSIRNTLCVSEVAIYSGLLQFGKATRRKKQPIMVSVGGMEIPSTYYSVGKFIEFFRPMFDVEKIIGLPVFLPPAYLNDYYVQVRRVARYLEGLDRALSDKYPFNRLGDQTLYVFRRK